MLDPRNATAAENLTAREYALWDQARELQRKLAELQARYDTLKGSALLFCVAALVVVIAAWWPARSMERLVDIARSPAASGDRFSN